MTHIAEWLKVLIVVVVLGNLIDFILPQGDLKRYGGLVVGLVVLAMIVSPLWTWMHQLGSQVPLPPTNWTNSPSGFDQVVQTEELHQAETIVLSMPGVQHCQLTRSPNGTVWAQITLARNVTEVRASHYVHDALAVAMGKSPPVTLIVRAHNHQTSGQQDDGMSSAKE
jgi:stage III sporulation protein AF